MPQLSPALGILIFLGVLSFFLLLIVALKQESKPLPPTAKTSKSSTKTMLFIY